MRDNASGWISLSPTEFSVLWTARDVGDLPPVLEVPLLGRTEAGRTQLRAAVSESMSERDLGTVADPADDVGELIAFVAAASTFIELEVDTPDLRLRATGAFDGARAAVVAAVADEVRIGPTLPASVVPTMLEVLPELPPGQGMPANVGVADYQAACRAGRQDGVTGFTESLQQAGVRGDEVTVLTRAVVERAGGGRLTGKATDGRRVRSPVSWVDTPHGRYAIRRHDDWVTVTPAALDRLARMADEMLADVR